MKTEKDTLTIKEMIVCWAALLLIKMINPTGFGHEISEEIGEIKHLLINRKPELKNQK